MQPNRSDLTHLDKETAMKKKPLQPDWSAINRSFDAKQRRAFNAFRCRLFELIDNLEFEAVAGDYPPLIRQPAIKLRAAICSIPCMFK